MPLFETLSEEAKMIMLLMLILLKQRDVPTGFVFGSFCAIAVILLGHQLISIYRQGFMYSVMSKRVYREKNPIKFKILLFLHTLSVIMLAVASIYAFLN